MGVVNLCINEYPRAIGQPLYAFGTYAVYANIATCAFDAAGTAMCWVVGCVDQIAAA